MSLLLSLLLGVSNFGIPARTAGQPIDYDHVIAEVPDDPIADPKRDLRKCISNWESIGAIRATPPVRQNQDEIFVEVGSTGYADYRFLIVTESAAEDAEGAVALSEDLRLEVKAVLEVADRFESSASVGTLDGNCYFVTVYKASEPKTIAIYGSLSSSDTGKRVANLLSLPSRARSDQD